MPPWDQGQPDASSSASNGNTAAAAGSGFGAAGGAGAGAAGEVEVRLWEVMCPACGCWVKVLWPCFLKSGHCRPSLVLLVCDALNLDRDEHRSIFLSLLSQIPVVYLL